MVYFRVKKTLDRMEFSHWSSKKTEAEETFHISLTLRLFIIGTSFSYKTPSFHNQVMNAI